MVGRSRIARDGELMSEFEPISGRDLAAFVLAVETKSVQGAAEAINLTQSATTKRLQALERRLGCTLLVRTSHGVMPNEVGRALYPEAKEALRALARVEKCVELSEDDADLRVAASHTIGEFLLPGWLGRFQASGYPHRARVDIVNSPGVVELVDGGDAEIGFVEGVDPLVRFDIMVLLRDEIVVVVAPAHRWATGTTVRSEALASEPYATREIGSGTRRVATDRLEQAGVALVPVLQVPSVQSLKRSVMQGGFTLLSRLAVEDELRAGTLRALSVEDVDMHRELRAIRKSTGNPSPVASAWWEWMQMVVAESAVQPPDAVAAP